MIKPLAERHQVVAEIKEAISSARVKAAHQSQALLPEQPPYQKRERWGGPLQIAPRV